MKKLAGKEASKAVVGRPSWAEIIRQAANDSGMTIYRLSQLTGIQRTALGNFMEGKSGLSLEKAQELARAVGLDIGKR